MTSYSLLILNIFLALILLTMFIWPRIRPRFYAKLLDSREFNKKISERGQLIDVREAAEFRRKHILGARNIPASQVKESLSSFSKDRDILLYESGGARSSSSVARKLKKAGYENIFILKGGLSNWGGKVKENR